jgi:hypothetical protein
MTSSKNKKTEININKTEIIYGYQDFYLNLQHKLSKCLTV